MKTSKQYLYDYLQDEFRKYPEVRVRIVPYQEEDGISVKTEAREYFFETAWAEASRFDRVNELVQRIKDVLPERF